MEDTLNTFHRVMSFAGIPIFSQTNWNSNSCWLAFQLFNFVVGLLCFVFTTGFVVTNRSDMILCIQGACIWSTGIIMTISLGVCFVFRNDFRNFLKEMAFKDAMLEMPLVNYVLSVKDGKKLMELKNLVLDSQKKLLYFTKILLLVYVASVWLCATLYLCSPIYQMIHNEDESLRLLAFDMWFPWSLQNFNVYIASFVFHAYAGYLCCIAYPGLQSTIILLIGQLIRQVRIMTFILLNLNELALEMMTVERGQWQLYCTSILCQCVDHYVKIKRFSNRLNVICRPFYLALILTAIILVCMCSVRIAISDKFSPEIMKYYVHEFCFVLVVFMFCLLGQLLQNGCAAMEVAVFEKWYIFDRNHRINIRIFKMALSHTMPIYIFGSIPLSLPTFTWFLKTGMSFFTLVMSVLEE